MWFQNLPLQIHDKLRFIFIIGLIEHIAQANFCCLGYFMAGLDDSEVIGRESFMPFVVAGGALLVVLSFVSGWFTDYDRKHQHRGLQVSSVLVFVGILVEAIVSLTSNNTHSGKILIIVK